MSQEERNIFYSADQLERAIVPHLTKAPKWLVLGGPADANEAQCARRLWPEIKIVGTEPNHEARLWQVEHGWPSDCWLLPFALSNESGFAEMVYSAGALRNASLDPEAKDGNRNNPNAKFATVPTVTLDQLDSEYGPFEDAIVWMDIEGSELRALRGATNLIASGRVLLWNIEMQNRVPGLMDGVPALLKGYKAVKDWNDSETCRDRIFVQE